MWVISQIYIVVCPVVHRWELLIRKGIELDFLDVRQELLVKIRRDVGPHFKLTETTKVCSLHFHQSNVMYIRELETDEIKHGDCLCCTFDSVSVYCFVLVTTNTTRSISYTSFSKKNANEINKQLRIDFLIVFLEDINITFVVFVQIFRCNLTHLQSFNRLILNSISQRPTGRDGSLTHSNTIRYDKKN